MIRPVVAATLAAVLTACASPPRAPQVPRSAEEAALAPFALADASLGPPPDLDAMARVFDRERFSPDPTDLLEALAALRGVEGVRVVASERLAGLDRVAFDLEGAVDGRGLAEFSLHVEPCDAGEWRVVWFHAPDASWPPPADR